MGCLGRSTQESIRLLPGKTYVTNGGHNVNNGNVDPDADSRSEESTLPGGAKVNKAKLALGYVLCFFGVALMTTGIACAQALDKSIPHSELNGFRFSFQLVTNTPFLIGYNKCDLKVNKNAIVWVAVSAVLLTLASYGRYGSVYYLPLGVSSGMTCSFLLIFNFLIGGIRHRYIKWYDLVSVIVCLAGVAMVTQPAFIFHNSSMSGNHSHSACHVNSIIAPPSNITTNWTSDESHNMKINSQHNDEITGYILCVSSAVVIAAYMQLVNMKLGDVNSFIYNFWAFSVWHCVIILHHVRHRRPILPNTTLVHHVVSTPFIYSRNLYHSDLQMFPNFRPYNGFIDPDTTDPSIFCSSVHIIC